MKNNIPQLKNPTPPPPKKKSIWERYSKGEMLKPTYDKIYSTSNILKPNLIIRSQPIAVKHGADPFGEFADFFIQGFKKILKSIV